MQKLVWVNSKGTEINLTSGDYGITEWEGFSACDVEVQTQNVPFQDGSVFLDALLNNRELSVTLAINDGKDLEKRYRLRRELISALNPKLGEGYLIYTNDFISKRIKCLAQMPVFPTHNSDKAGTPKASLSWTACDPYWEDLEEKEVNIPVNQQVQIINDGDLNCQLKIKLSGKTDFIRLNNVSTDKKLEFLDGNNEFKFINTAIGQKEILNESLVYKSILSTEKLNDCIYSNLLKKVVIVGDNNSFYLLNEDMNIEFKDFSLFETENIKGIVEACNNLFICTESAIYKSDDFITWTKIYDLSEGVFSGIKYISYVEKIVAYGNSFVISEDGETWAEISCNSLITDLAFSDNLTVATGENKLCLTSSNLTVWNEYELPIFAQTNGLCFDKKRSLFLLLEHVGDGQVSANSRIYKSTNGSSWQIGYFANHLNNEGDKLLNLYYSSNKDDVIVLANKGRYTFISDISHSYSVEKLELIDLSFGFSIPQIHNDIVLGSQAIIQSNGVNFLPILYIPKIDIFSFIKSQDSYYLSGHSDYGYLILKSNDFKKWDAVKNDSEGNKLLYYVKPINQIFALCINGKKIFKSDNGVLWNRQDISSNNDTISDMAWSDDGEVLWIIGLYEYYRSYDKGNSWTLITPSQYSGGKIIFIKKENVFLLCNGSGRVYKSNGKKGNFTDLLIEAGATTNFKSISYSELLDIFIVVGFQSGQTISPKIYIYDFNNNIYNYADLISVPQFDANNYPLFVLWNYELNCFFIITNQTKLYKSQKGKEWELIYSFYTSISCLEKDILAESKKITRQFINKENALNTISANSNMDIGLKVGSNSIVIISETNKINCSLTYRQKYIGV